MQGKKSSIVRVGDFPTLCQKLLIRIKLSNIKANDIIFISLYTFWPKKLFYHVNRRLYINVKAISLSLHTGIIRL